MNYEYCTHVPLLYEACRMTSGTVVELGAGLCSTPLLDALLTYGEKPRQLISVDDSASWLVVMKDRCHQKRSGPDTHTFLHVMNWTDHLLPLIAMKPSVVFIDQGHVDDFAAAGLKRLESVKLFKDAEILIIHDWSTLLAFGLVKNGFLDSFTHVYEDRHTKPTTLWLSNSRSPEYTMRKES